MKFRSSIDFSDLPLSIASSGLAFACAFFAGFMMLKVEGGRGGPEALPGAGQVTRIEKISGHWQVAAGGRTIAEEIQ